MFNFLLFISIQAVSLLAKGLGVCPPLKKVQQRPSPSISLPPSLPVPLALLLAVPILVHVLFLLGV
jgi:hypothetical protein